MVVEAAKQTALHTLSQVENVELDFTGRANTLREGQPKAILTASLAKKLLKHYAESLTGASLNYIVEQHIADLRSCDNIDDVISASMDFVEERDLINNVANSNWDAYKVEEI